MPEERLDESYAKLMGHYPHGIALYYPLPYEIFKPGTCGYFNEFGQWCRICDVSDTVAEGLLPVEGKLEKAPVDKGIVWYPKTATSTKGLKVKLSAGADPVPGIPVTVSAIYEYSSNTDQGAVLLTKPPITNDRFFHSGPCKDWVAKNAEAIMKQWPAVKEHPLWVVTSVYTAEKCAINMWNKGGQTFKVGFNSDVVGAAKASTGIDFYHTPSDEGWSDYERAEGSVVFFCGLFFRYSRKTFTGREALKPKQAVPRFRGVIPENPQVIVPEITDPDTGAVFELEYTRVEDE